MNQTILLALIAAAGAIVGAVFTFLASYFPAKQKIKELELLYQQKLDETERTYKQQLDKVYQEKAGEYVESLFLPLNFILVELEDKHDRFRNVLSDVIHGRFAEISHQEEIRKMVHQATREYEQACANYLQKVTELRKRNLNAYLTTQFESYLRNFNRFIEDSLRLEWNFPRLFITQVAHVRRVYKKRFKLLGRTTEQYDQEHSGKETRDYNIPFEEIMHSAIIISDLYDTRFRYGIGELKALIKELTLGVKPERQNPPYEIITDTTTS